MILQQNRRDFIKTLGIGTGAVFMSPLLSQCGSPYRSELFEKFRNPSAEAKPFFRWWWNGNRLSREEIVRELKLMKEAGIGGIEINPIKMPDQVENPTGKALTWLSDEWIEYLEFTVQQAKDLGMVTDLIVGTGWPFGGEFLDPEETIQGIKVETLFLEGPIQKEITLPKATNDQSLKILSIKLFPSVIKSLTDGQDIAFEPDNDSVTFNVPSGKHTLHVVSWQNNFRTVMHGAPGGAGPVLDHFNKNAVNKYLSNMSDAIKRKTGKNSLEGIRAMFCDSIELNGSNWTTGFEQTFKARRGYDIAPYLPLLLTENLSLSEEMVDELKRARYDYSQTLAETFTESFIIPFHDWCHQNGTQSRYQAYGHPWLYTDLIDGYMIPDIPEGDQWLFNGAWQPYADVNQIRYAIWNKYASSGGHLKARKIISSEAMTNTSGVFKASLKYIKQATDVNIATGINHLVLHGFNYSPPEAGFPGWIRYGCYFNEHNPWWKYMTNWSQYTSRLCQVFQEAQPVSQIAIMGPTKDIWANHGLDRNPFNLDPWYLHALWQALNHNGYGTDYINDQLFQSATLEDGKLVVGQMHYDAILICDVETMDPETASHLEELTLQGAQIILIGRKPKRAPSMLGALKQNGIVSNAIDNALNAGLLTAPSPEDDLKESKNGLMMWARELMNNSAIPPDLSISNPSPDLFQLHQEYGDVDIIFMSNTNEEQSYSTSVSIGDKTRYAARWDPETGESEKLQPNENNQLEVALDPLESTLIVCDPKDKRSYSNIRKAKPIESYEISSPWIVTLKSMDGTEESITLDSLKPINQINDFQDFGGDIVYKTEFEISEEQYSCLQLEEVYETAEVMLNGKNIGLSWWGNNQFDLKGQFKRGRNSLEIKVTTLLANYCRSLEDNKTAQHWTLRYRDKSPLNCGLVGKVLLF
jgi:hypothetical protein